MSHGVKLCVIWVNKSVICQNDIFSNSNNRSSDFESIQPANEDSDENTSIGCALFSKFFGHNPVLIDHSELSKTMPSFSTFFQIQKT